MWSRDIAIPHPRTISAIIIGTAALWRTNSSLRTTCATASPAEGAPVMSKRRCLHVADSHTMSGSGR
jgi:hypothetical protein